MRCDWEDYIDTINGAIGDAESISAAEGQDFARSVQEKLESIGKWVKEHQHITDGQAQAVDNMAEGLAAWL